LYYTFFIILLVIVFFYTVYSLIYPGITLEQMQDVLECSLSVHQHTMECRDEDGTLICGEADFVIHTHNENCYNADGRLICKLPEIAAHEHNNDCYEEQRILICTNKEEDHTHEYDCYQIEKKLICEETAVLHIHDDVCRDENGILTCGMLQVTEHKHNTVCFPTEEETTAADTTNDVTTTTTDTVNDVMLMADMANAVMPAADTANALNWGYNDDGSIWWSNTSLQQITYADIVENTPYIIAGNSRLNVLTNKSADSTKMTTKIPGKSNIGAYKNYEIWYFEKVEGSENEYRIYDVNRQYLKLAGEALSLTSEEEATAFMVEQATLAELEQCVTIKSDGNYLNTYGNDNFGCWGWGGYNELDSGDCLQILKMAEGVRNEAAPIVSNHSPNTIINLFDYWVSDNPDNRYDPDNRIADLESGINKGHALKFVYGDQDGTADINKYIGRNANPRQGIVQNHLDNDRYPVLSGSFQEIEDSTEGSANVSTESLKYLFDPTYEHPGKKSYRNAAGLLSIDDEGYYYFDSGTNAAEFNEESNSFNVYNKSSDSGQFFPFNHAPEVMTLTRDNVKMNHYFGATITTRFVQQNSGYTDIRHSTPTTFEFSGDDDVWIFIDDVLIGDVGGIHDKAKVNINFVTGEVEVVVNGGSSPLKTTLKECYVNAEKYNPDEWIEENGTATYKDNTIHTLKFFYLERGNYDSNMKLRYNLTAIPQTAIYKVNQYGEAVPGATFAIYAADEEYHMLYEKNGARVELPESSLYDSSGNLVDSTGEIIAHVLYTGTTNQEGEMIFTDQDGMPYSINELQNMFGVHFILREIKVPDGYRVVTKDVHLQIWEGESQRILRCDNTWESGSRAASNMQITATDTLYLKKPYKDQNFVQYCNEKGEPSGTLFAVVYRYIGNIDEYGNATGVNESSNWVPVYGNDREGYKMVDMDGIAGALEAARKARNYGDVLFEHSSAGTMQLTLKNLPGHITTYYHMLAENQKEQTRYTVAYYWTDRASLDEATPENIYRVDSFAGTTTEGHQYSGFELVYGADIHVPNLINKVFVQKVDENNNLINGATFAIYEVKQSESGKIEYRLEDGSYHALSENAAVSSKGIITDGNISISPLKTDITRTYDDNNHTGTAEFTNLSEGQYIIKEVKPPPGYKLNTADVMLLVTEDTIYANAGTEDDGVTVGRGPGYLVTPLSQFASEGQIDNTLTWIYAQMRISEESTSFADIGDEDRIKGYISKNNTCETINDESKAFKTYLKYEVENEKKAFNYVPDDVRNEGKDSDGYRRLFTTVGWPYYEIYQDYEYGKDNANGANYEDWRDHELTHLFSRSTYIRVTDEREPSLKVKKVDNANRDTVLAGAEFRLYKMQKSGNSTETELLYYCWNSETKTAGWSDNVDDALIVITDEYGMSDKEFIGLADGEYYLEEVNSPDGYCKLSEPLKLILKEPDLTLDTEIPHNEQSAVVDKPDEDNPHTYTVTVYNYPSFELPATGGSGTIPYTMGGLLLMAVPLVCVYIGNRRNKRMMK